MAQPKVPHDVAAIRKKIASFLDSKDTDGHAPCNAKCGVYIFYDYDGEPIYVGQNKRDAPNSDSSSFDEPAHRRGRHERPRPI